MIAKIILPICLAFVVILYIFPNEVYAQGPVAECPPNSNTIWVQRTQYGDPAGEILLIPFESGTYPDDDPMDQEGTLSNYITGVLESEIGTTTETNQWWEDEFIKAMAVIIRSIGYDWCGVQLTLPNGEVHYGVLDYNQQTYRPGHAAARANHYADLVLQVQGQYMTYNGQTFRAQYRPYVGAQSQNQQSNGPHKGILDPVAGSQDLLCRTAAGNEYTINPQPGLGKHSANHWLTGEHNLDGMAPVYYSATMNCIAMAMSQYAPNPRWVSYLQLLAHYYTNIQIVDANGNILTPDYRWNALEVNWNGNASPPTMSPGVSYPVTIRLQNSGSAPFPANIQLSCQWRKPDGDGVDCPSSDRVNPDTLNPGATNTVELRVTPSADFAPGVYTLRLDLRIGGQYFHDWEAPERPWFTQDVAVTIVGPPGPLYLPLVLRSSATPPPTEPETPVCAQVKNISLTNQDFGGDLIGWNVKIYKSGITADDLIAANYKDPTNSFPAALLGGVDPSYKDPIDSYISQQFNVPNAAAGREVWLNVEYSYCLTTMETVNRDVDEFWIEIRTSDLAGVVNQGVHYSNVNRTDPVHNNCNPHNTRATQTGWRRRGWPKGQDSDYETKNLVGDDSLWVDATEFKGQPLAIIFRDNVDRFNPTIFYFDNISIRACITN